MLANSQPEWETASSATGATGNEEIFYPLHHLKTIGGDQQETDNVGEI